MNKKPFIIIVSSLVAFALVAALVTYGMIQTTINKKIEANQSGEIILSSGEETEEKENLKHSLGINVNGTFNENPITWVEQAYKEGNTEIKYYKITGLVNKEIEKSINEKLKDAAFKLFDPKKINTVSFNSYQNIYSSFSNVISVRTSINTSNIDGRTNYKYETIDVNLNLVTGEEIKFKELFVDENSMVQLMASEFYEDEAWSKQWEKETDYWDGGYEFNQDLWDAPVLDIDEDEVVRKVNRLRKADTNSFVFSTQYVSAEMELSSGDTEYIYLRFNNMPTAIAIYDRYLTDKKIYEDESLGRKNIINLSHLNMDPSVVYSAYENDKTTNYFADIQVYSDMYDESYENEEKAKEHIINIAKKEVVELERKAQSEPDKFFVYTKVYRIYDSPGEMFSVSENYSEYFTDISSKEKLYQEVVDAYTFEDFEMYGIGNIYIDLESEENAYISGERNFVDRNYSFKTMIEIKSVEDLFFDGVDYKTTLRDEFNKIWLQKTGDYLAGEELEKEFQATEFEHTTRWIGTGTGNTNVLEVYNETLGYYKSPYNDDYRNSDIYIPLTVFNPEDLTI